MRLKGYYSNWCDQKKIQVTSYVFNWLSLNYLVLSLHATDRLNLELAQKDEKLNIEHLKFHISGTNELRAESSRKIFWSPAVRRLSVNCLQLLKNHWANMNQTWHKKFWVKGIQISFNEGPGPFLQMNGQVLAILRRDNNEIHVVTMHWPRLTIFPKTTGPITTNLTKSILGWRGLNFLPLNGQDLLQGEIIVKIHWQHLKNPLQWANLAKLGTAH